MKKILIIEDDENLCRELADLLTNSGYEAAVLKDFSDALGEIRRAEPDLILLDINIPVCNGEMLLKDLRKESDVPVIMVTSRSGEADEVLSMSNTRSSVSQNPTIRRSFCCGSEPFFEGRRAARRLSPTGGSESIWQRPAFSAGRRKSA